MNFVEDFEIKKNQKIDEEFLLNVKASFFLHYLDQISEKLGLTMEEIEVEEKDKTTKIVTKNKVIRCSMEMLKVPPKLKIDKTVFKNKINPKNQMKNMETKETNIISKNKVKDKIKFKEGE